MLICTRWRLTMLRNRGKSSMITVNEDDTARVISDESIKEAWNEMSELSVVQQGRFDEITGMMAKLVSLKAELASAEKEFASAYLVYVRGI